MNNNYVITFDNCFLIALFLLREITLFDFTNVKNLDDWVETSDTVRTVGMSKAVLTLQKTQVFQRAILFTLLNPQENGAAFAGVRTPTRLDLSNYKTIEISCRAQGANENYKIILRHNGMSVQDVGYEKFFSVRSFSRTTNKQNNNPLRCVIFFF